MKTKEIFKDVTGYEGLYQVSNLGRVKSLEKLVIFKNGRKRVYKESIRKLHFNKQRGYWYVSLRVSGNTKTISIHTLVYKTFKNHIKGLVVDHIDNDQSNNKLSNLQQISYRENSTKDKKTPNYTYVKKYNKYMAYIYYNKRNNHLGYFKTEEEAIKSINNFKNKNNV